MKKKRSFLLLEVLLAMTLLALCAGSLMRQPIRLHQAEVEQLEQIEYDRIAAWTYTEIREKLLKEELSWPEIPPLKEKSKPFLLPDAVSDLPTPHSIARSYTLHTLREKHGANGEIIRLISLHLELGSGKKKRPFSYQINIVKDG